jgi:hypothetical protein
MGCAVAVAETGRESRGHEQGSQRSARWDSGCDHLLTISNRGAGMVEVGSVEASQAPVFTADRAAHGGRGLDGWASWRDVLLAWLLALLAVLATLVVPIEVPTVAPTSGMTARIPRVMPTTAPGPDAGCSERDFAWERC